MGLTTARPVRSVGLLSDQYNLPVPNVPRGHVRPCLSSVASESRLHRGATPELSFLANERISNGCRVQFKSCDNSAVPVNVPETPGDDFACERQAVRCVGAELQAPKNRQNSISGDVHPWHQSICNPRQTHLESPQDTNISSHGTPLDRRSHSHFSAHPIYAGPTARLS